MSRFNNFLFFSNNIYLEDALGIVLADGGTVSASICGYEWAASPLGLNRLFELWKATKHEGKKAGKL